ncbi:threonine/serine exporter family protein [Demequina sp. TTPB684]|uniref:threonine/serine ThrE exporter family protein n=1 Tax=unclassified Demequina TaxID=2620311 RepID=UPI001CF2CAC6|nr:threonine/serine exporter family protein [Demequina sp. TMPB413]MCB2413859.1 threonine/serine exporter family protein [Demequina sp. TTPB684]UPU89171.1 threonine/serine exporter family protein [Demequina sp. TMPB413]
MTSSPPPAQDIDADELGRRSNAILRLGLLMLGSGTASYRVKQGMKTVAKSLGIEEHSEQVTLTEITTTSRVGQLFRTEVSELRHNSVNADRIARLDRFRRHLPSVMTPAEVHRALDEIERQKPMYNRWLNSTFAGAACAGFAVLNRARILEVVVVFVAAFMGQWVRRELAHRSFNAFGTVLVAATVATTVYIGSLALLSLAGTGLETHASGYISSVLFLLPGFALITGALDLAKNDYSAGIIRVVHGTSLTLAAAAAVWGVSLLSPLDTSARPPIDVGLVGDLGIKSVASFVGVLGFALLFNSPWRMALTAALIGLVNVPRMVLIENGMPVQTATFLACLVLGVLAATGARGGRWPVITLQVPASLVQIPGVLAHEAVVSLNEARYIDATAGILQVLLTVLAILIGLVVAKYMTDRHWAFES